MLGRHRLPAGKRKFKIVPALGNLNALRKRFQLPSATPLERRLS